MKTQEFLQSQSRLLRIAAMTLLLVAGTFASSRAQVTYADSLALVEIYNSTNGSGWSSSVNWLTGPVSTWQGVGVTGDRVTSLALSFNNLTGTLPYHIGFLQKLNVLRLPGNSIGGSIPSAIVFLSNLEDLNLSNNNFTGNIPPLLGLNLKLTTVNLGSNQLSGPIPSSIVLLQKLTNLDLSENNLQGQIPVPLGLIKGLKTLYLNDNQLTGNIPVSFGFLQGSVEIHLASNLLTGAIPSSIGNLDTLLVFDASNNDLTGNVPSTVTTMESLFHLDVSGNEISGLPDMSAMASLGQLRVRDNRLTFEDLVPNKPKMVSPSFYVPQDSVGTAQTVSLCVGDTLRLSADFTGSLATNRYRWLSTDGTFSTATSADPNLVIPNVQVSDSRTYFARGTNTVAVGLTIIRRPVVVTVSACGSFESMMVYPTPFENEASVQVNSTEEEDLSIAIRDKEGRLIETINGLKTNSELKIGSQLNGGLYFLEAAHGGKKEVIRIIKK